MEEPPGCSPQLGVGAGQPGSAAASRSGAFSIVFKATCLHEWVLEEVECETESVDNLQKALRFVLLCVSFPRQPWPWPGSAASAEDRQMSPPALVFWNLLISLGLNQPDTPHLGAHTSCIARGPNKHRTHLLFNSTKIPLVK